MGTLPTGDAPVAAMLGSGWLPAGSTQSGPVRGLRGQPRWACGARGALRGPAAGLPAQQSWQTPSSPGSRAREQCSSANGRLWPPLLRAAAGRALGRTPPASGQGRAAHPHLSTRMCAGARHTWMCPCSPRHAQAGVRVPAHACRQREAVRLHGDWRSLLHRSSCAFCLCPCPLVY